MKDIWKPLLAGFGIVFGMLLALCLFAWLALSNICGDELISIVRSPDKTHLLVVYVRNCGATTPYYTFVAIGKATGSMDLPKHLETLCTVKDDGDNVFVKWLSPNKVVVHAPKDLMDFYITHEPKTLVNVIYQDPEGIVKRKE